MRLAAASLLLLVAACKTTAPSAAAPPAPSSPPAEKPSAIGRLELNQLAARLNLPLYWMRDADGDGQPDPDEVTALLYYPSSEEWAKPGKIAADLGRAVADMRRAAATPVPPGLSAEESERRKLVISELDQGAPTLVRSDLRSLSEDDRRFVGRVLAAADHIDALYAIMTGARALEARLPADDAASASLFRRNWGPRCVAPKTAQDPRCSAIPGAPKPVYDIYPAELQSTPGFCEALQKRKDGKRLLDPFVVVRQDRKGPFALPYHQAYKKEMGAVASELRAAAGALADPKEDALRAYLRAAADGFESNVWGPADEAWARMDAHSSRWYLRVAPDETYWEPCAQKAGFHVTFARINQDSLAWQSKLTPLQQGMEARLAGLIGKPYRERKVSFHLPDFVDIIINAADDRDPMGATIGQSLPNWGKVAEQGRGRTVAMTNLYKDEDSVAMARKQAESLLSRESMADYPTGDEPGLVGTILHEATHNLGPAVGYTVDGKSDAQAVGGQLAAMLEELKAQSGALFFIGELARSGVVDEKLARQAWVNSIEWALGQVSRGMVDEKGAPLAYGQLAAIQLGFLMDEGAMRFDRSAPAANGSDHGAFILDLARFPAATEKLMTIVGRIKATGARGEAEALVAKYVTGDVVPKTIIAERFLRFPKQSFVYAVER